MRVFLSAVRLQVPDQAFGELGNVRGEAGRGEAETENYAHRGVPYFQSRIPAKQEHHYAGQQCQRYRYRQMITSFQLGLTFRSLLVVRERAVRLAARPAGA